MKEGKWYSFAWAQNESGDSTCRMFINLWKTKSVSEVMDIFDDLDSTNLGFNALPGNYLFAENLGNIGYQAAVALPVRKDKTPFIGARVLDGTSSAYDWESGKLASIKELARSVNPKKGYIVTANNRQTSDNVKFDHGASHISTARSRRINEIIEQGISNGKKFTVEDMNAIQLDLIDIDARETYPLMVSMAR